MDKPRFELRAAAPCAECNATGFDLTREPCEACDGDGWNYEHRRVTTADHVADLAALPPAERVARLVALLRAVPEEAVHAVDRCKVARAWVGDRNRHRLPLALGSDALHTARSVSAGVSVDWRVPFGSFDEAEAWCDADLERLGWVLAGRVTP